MLCRSVPWVKTNINEMKNVFIETKLGLESALLQLISYAYFINKVSVWFLSFVFLPPTDRLTGKYSPLAHVLIVKYVCLDARNHRRIRP